MIKNLKIKKLLINTIFRGLSVINSILPKEDNMVLLYSNMGFRDNVGYLYTYMIEHNYNINYRIIRSQNEPFVGIVPSNVVVVNNIEAIFYYLKAGHVFYTFGKLPIYPSKNQKVVQMWHGSPFKGADKKQESEITNNHTQSYYTNVLSASEIFTEFWAEKFDCGKKRISICGHPRTDVMIYPYRKEELDILNKKLVIWMPTFRKSKKLGYDDIATFNNIIPIVEDSEFQKLNTEISKLNIYLIVKLHPMQDTDSLRTIKFSNINLMTHEKFNNMGLDLYRLLGTADALITDYSSVFYDFMLINRPIAFTEDDIDDYKESRGFAVNDPNYFRAGHKIKTFNDLITFLKDVSEENDPWKEQRNKVNNKVNKYRDFMNSKRALKIGGVFEDV